MCEICGDPKCKVDQLERFNLEEAFQKEVQPLVEALRKKCEELDLPFLAAFTMAIDDEGSHLAACNHLSNDKRRIPAMEQAFQALHGKRPPAVTVIKLPSLGILGDILRGINPEEGPGEQVPIVTDPGKHQKH